MQTRRVALAKISRTDGYTLVEMLVSLAILAMMAGLLLRGLQTVALVTNRGVSQVDAQDGIVAVQSLLRSRIEQLRAEVDRNSAVPIIDANGDEESFSFIAPPLARGEPDALWRYRITASATGDLMLFTANSLDDRFNFAERTGPGWRASTLLKNVQTIRINYYGPRRLGGGTGWQVTWLQRPQPPALVRIRIAFMPGDRRQWPELIVRPRATENTACRIDLLSGRCGGAS